MCITLLLSCNSGRAEDTLRVWTSTVGTTVEAEYAGRTQGVVKLRKSDGEVIEIPMTSLSAADSSWILMREARRNQEKETSALLPPGKLSETLPVFRKGDESGFHAFFEGKLFDAGLTAEGHLRIYLKENRSRIGEPLDVYMDCFTRGEDIDYMSIPVLGYYAIPDPEKQPDTVTLHGILKREVPFRLIIRFSEQGLAFEAVCEDPSGLRPHTTLRLRVRIPGYPPAEEIRTTAERQALLKGWQVVSSPREGKALSYPYAEIHESMGGLNQKIEIDAPLFGTRRITFLAPEPEIAWLVPNPLPGYRGMQLWKGFTVACTKSYTEDNPKPLLFEINLKEEL